MKLITKILQLGVFENQTEELKSQTIWLNKISIFTIVAIGFYMYMHITLKSSFTAIIFDFFYITTAISVIFFQSKQKYKIAYYFIGIGYTVSFSCSAMLIGPQNQVEYLIFISTLGTIMLFDNIWIRRLFFFFGFLDFLFLKIFFIYYPKGLLQDDFSPIFSIANGLVVFGIVYIIVDKALKDSNLALNKLIDKNEEMKELNVTLEEKVTERTKEIKQKSKALERSNEELKRFSYIAAHDLREPLRNIIGFSQLMNLSIEKKSFEKIEEYNGYIKWSVGRIDAITRDIVDYTELENRLKNVSLVDISTIISTVINTQKEKRKDIIFNVLTNDFPKVFMNETLARMLFNQLIDNAIAYCDKPEPKIAIQCIQKSNFYQFSISDNGIGIAPEYHEQIFVMFKRLHNDIKKNGSGIGLSMTKKIVEGYGGEIWLESQFGKGSTFYFTVPIS